MMRSGLLVCTCLAVVAVAPNTAFAQETTSYSYDVHGRVVGWAYAGTVNNGIRGSNSIDPADNVTNKSIAQQAASAVMMTPEAEMASIESSSDGLMSMGSSTASEPTSPSEFSTSAQPEANEAPSPR